MRYSRTVRDCREREEGGGETGEEYTLCILCTCRMFTEHNY